MDVPAYQPSTDRRPPMSRNGEVSSDSAAPRTISRPRGAKVVLATVTHGPAMSATVGGLAVDVVRRAELPGERLLVLTPGDRGGAEPHPCRILYAQVAEPAEAEDRDEVARPGAAVAQRVERCHAGAHQRRGVRRGQLRGHPCEGRRRGDQVVGVAAVERDASHLRAGLAGEEVAAAAVGAGEARRDGA